MYDEQQDRQTRAGLFLIVNDQGSDHARDPSAQGEEEDDEE